MSLPALSVLTKDSRFDRPIGGLSYPVYLVHWYFVGLGPIAAIGTSILAAAVLVQCVDQPVERFRRWRRNNLTAPVANPTPVAEALSTLNPRWRLDDSISWCRSQGSWRTDNFEAKNLLAFSVAPIILNFTV